MGAINSKKATDHVVGREEFSKWTIADVRAAFYR